MNTGPQQVPRIDYPAPDPAKPYVYPGTQVLINHFGIMNGAVLQRVVDTEKLGQDFVPATDIPGSFQDLHDELAAAGFLRGLDPGEFADRLAHYWYGVYAVHVFRDGNSRTMRHFFAGLAAAAGCRLDFSAIDRTALLTACRERYFNDDTETLRDCLRQITYRG